MSKDLRGPKLLTAVANEGEAALLVQALEQRGIQVWLDARPTALSQVVPPFHVAILVRQEEFEQARAALAGIQGEEREVDWSQVDVGVTAEEAEPRVEPVPTDKRMPPPEKVARGRKIFWALLAASLGLGLAQSLHFRSFDFWDLARWTIWGLVWFECWRGTRWVIAGVAFVSALAAFVGLFPPYSIDGFSLVPWKLYVVAVALLFFFSPSLNAFFKHQRLHSSGGR